MMDPFTFVIAVAAFACTTAIVTAVDTKPFIRIDSSARDRIVDPDHFTSLCFPLSCFCFFPSSSFSSNLELPNLC